MTYHFAQYGQDTGNPAATFHEVRVWKERYEPEGKPLIPLRMVRALYCVRRRSNDLTFFDCVTRTDSVERGVHLSSSARALRIQLARADVDQGRTAAGRARG